MVASQAMREYTLIGGAVDPCLEITAIRYCILERIGRSRYLGEVTQGKVSLLQEVERDAKLLFYNRKFLTTFGLVTKQVCRRDLGNTHNIVMISDVNRV